MLIFGIIFLGLVTTLAGIGGILSYRRNRSEIKKYKEYERNIS